MTTGVFLTYVCAALCIAYPVMVFIFRCGGSKYSSAVRSASDLLCAGLVVALLALLAGRDYSYEYVWRTTDNGLPLMLRVSALWAASEGSLLVWAFAMAVVNFIALRKNAAASAVMKSAEAVVWLYMIVNNPFFVMNGAVPVDGSGMNPVLRNFWMAIHPPFVFAGYAAALVPFAMYAASIIKGDLKGWIAGARGWICVAFALTGVGILLGGYWSYGVLGWGGYWAWDPVENGALLIWIALCGLLHGVVASGMGGGFAVWSGVYAAVAFVMVFFSSCLTRSGVGAGVGFSVHTFESSDIAYEYVISMVVVVAGAVWMVMRGWLLARAGERVEEPVSGRSYLMNVGLYSIWAWFGFVALGVVMALIAVMRVSGGVNAVMIGEGYYNRTTVVAFVPMCVAAFAVPFLFTKKGGAMPVGWLVAGVAGGVIAGAGGVMMGVTQIVMVVVLFLAGAVGVVSVVALVVGGKGRNAGAYLAHAGVALTVAGIVFSSSGARVDKLDLKGGMPGLAGNVGVGIAGAERKPWGHVVRLSVVSGGRAVKREMDFPEGNSEMIPSPVIIRGVLRDVYITPVGVETEKDTGRIGRIYLQVAEKPFVWFVWAGAAMVVCGALIAARRRMSGKSVSS